MRLPATARLFSICALVLVGTLAGLAIAELGLRIAGISRLPQGIFFIGDRDTGWANRPSAAGTWYWEGNARVVINSQGLRDAEHEIAKPSGTYRIAVLGDSFAAAFQVDQADDFCSILEKDVAGCPGLNGRKLEVVNFGVNAFGTAQELITLERRVWQYSPDLVVLAFYPNDLYDDSKLLQQIYPDYAGSRPYFSYVSNQLIEDDAFAKSASFQSSLGGSNDPDSVFGEGYHRLLWKFRIWQLFKQVRQPANPPRPEESWLLSPPRDDNWKNAWRVTEGLISRFNQEVEAHGARFVLLVVSHSLQVYPGAQARKVLLDRARISDVFYVNSRLEALGRHEGFPVVSMAEPLQREADERGVFFHGFRNTEMGIGHWNERGHQRAGEAIANVVCRMLQASPDGARELQAKQR